MNSLIKKLVYTTVLLALSQQSFAATKAKSQPTKNKRINVATDVDTLGGNEDLIKKAQMLRAETKTRIVQNRIVDRNNRLELDVAFGGVLGGDAYMKTQGFSGAAQFHFTPRLSIGAQYNDFNNSLTSEGQRVFDNFRQQQQAGGGGAYAVDVDYPLNSTVGFINWYPLYGKTSFLDMGVTQFDIYLQLNSGMMQLSSGSTSVYGAGLGVGAWISEHFAIRTEAKYQTYEDKPITGTRRLHTANLSVGLGWIL